MPPQKTLVIYSGPTSMNRHEDKNGIYHDNMVCFLENGISCNDDSIPIAKVVLMTQLCIKPLQEGRRSCSRRPPLFVVPIERHYREFSTKVLWSKNAYSQQGKEKKMAVVRSLLVLYFSRRLSLRCS